MKYIHVYALFLMPIFCTSQVPNSMVRNIKQDRNGNNLIASYKGVFRYDARLAARAGSDGNDGVGQGNSFQNFTTKDGLPGNSVSSIIEDKTGKLWIVAGQLCFYDRKTFTVPSPFRIKDGKGFGISSITKDSKGNILFGSFKVSRKESISPGGVIYQGVTGLWRCDGSTVTNVSQTGARAVPEDKKGNIWTTGNLEMNGKMRAISRFDQKSLHDKKPAATQIMLWEQMPWVFANTGIVEADDGTIWFAGIGTTASCTAMMPA